MHPTPKLLTVRAQASFEYMAMIGIALAILSGLVTFAYFWTSASREEISISVADNTVYNLIESANLVYAQGYPARTTIVVQIPENTAETRIQGNSVSIRLRVRGGFTDVSANSKSNLTGELPSNPGYYKITVQSFGDYVNVSRAS